MTGHRNEVSRGPLPLAVTEAPDAKTALAREVIRRRPDVAVVVVSAQVTPRPGDLPGHVPFVERPFLESGFRDAVDRAEAPRTGGR